MDISPGAIGAVVAAIAVPIFMALMQNIKSLQHASNTEKPFDQLVEEYSKWENFSALLLIIFAGLIGFFLWKLLLMLANLQMSNLEQSQFIVSQPDITWALPAIFLSIFISAIPMHYLYLTLLGKRRYLEYTEYGNQKHGVDAWKLLRYLSNVTIPICLLFTFLSLDSYARITDSAFVVNRFFSLGETEYNFERIESIQLTKSSKAPNGDIVRKKFYIINFDDGTAYNFHRSLHDFNFKQQSDLINFIGDATNLDIKVHDPYPRL